MGSTDYGSPTNHMLKVALYNKLDLFWAERLQQVLGLVSEMCYQDMIREIEKTLELTYPESVCQAVLFRVKFAEGRTPARQYAHICNLAHDANLDKFNAEMIKIILTINSIDRADVCLCEKTLEDVGQQNQQMTDSLFKKLLAVQKAWYQSRTPVPRPGGLI